MENIKLLRPKNFSKTWPLQQFKHKNVITGISGIPEGHDTDKSPATNYTIKPIEEDKSFPRPVCFSWKPFKKTGIKDVTYCLEVSRNRQFSDLHVSIRLSSCSMKIFNLHIGTSYFWRITARCGNKVCAISPIWTFTTHQAAPRLIKVPGITNVRDLGGWNIEAGKNLRQGLIYRSSEMNNHLNITEEGIRIFMEELKVSTIIDLRGEQESPSPVIDPSVVQWKNIPVAGYGKILDEQYRHAYRDIFKIFSNPCNYPLVFHCWGGADRAGTLAFLLHSILGLSMDDKIKDYEFTTLSIWGERTHKSSEFKALLKALGTFGQKKNVNELAEKYLLDCGVTSGEIESIRNIMIGNE